MNQTPKYMGSRNMMIKAMRLSKSYQLGDRSRASYRTLRDSIMNGIGRTVSGVLRSSRLGSSKNAIDKPGPQSINALDDISSEIPPGKALGVIGHNGAGKSTMLKVLSRITEPTSGRVMIRGRVGSLLEVGTGFHPELTGRENNYLNGAILGMKRSEVARQFDAIVDFAEINEFLDTPVKRYSSGMYVRLGFAVAAHMEPEILMVDEVLSVGWRPEIPEKMHGAREEAP